jgi:carbohydrate kinase (thermoresistant glucokinase family)
MFDMKVASDSSAAAPAAHSSGPTILIVMGVSGSGKTTIGKALAARLGWPFEEGDDLHPAANVAKMHADIPLTDADRWPWLDKVAAWIDGWRQAGSPGVITCSALKRSYRRFIADGRPEVRFLYLHGDQSLIAARLAARKGHFMPADLLDSQLAALEMPDPEEHVTSIEIGPPADAIVAEIIRGLELERREHRRAS